MRNTTNQKNFSGKITCNNGVAFRSDIGFTLEKNPKSCFFPFFQLLLTIFSSAAVIFMAISFLDSELKSVSALPLVMTIILTSTAVMLLSQSNKFFRIIGTAYLVLNTAFVLFKLKETVSGMVYVAYAYTKKAKLSVPLFVNLITSSSHRNVDMFFMAFAFLLTLGISLACIYRTNFPILFLCTFPVFELGTFWGWEPATWTVVTMIICWITVLSLNLINHTTRNRNSTNTFAIYKKKKIFYLTSDRLKKYFFGYASTLIIIVTAAIFLLGIIATAFSDSYRPDNIDELRRSISNGFQNFTMELSNKTNISSDAFPGRGKMIGGTNGGRLGLYDEISFSGTTALNVETDTLYKPMYLRGYAAAIYLDNCWTPEKLDKSVQKVFKQTDNTALDYGWLQTVNTDSVTEYDIKIKTVNANKDLVYAPYQTNYSGCDNVEKQKYEGMISPDDANKKYAISAVLPDFGDWDSIIDYEESVSAEKIGGDYSDYDAYVNSTDDFTYVPSELTPLLDEILSGADTDSITEAADYIRNYFDENGFEYSLSPGITPSDKDFVEYFLTTQKKGYCTYYATAGVMLMRRLGYAARYVEGYVIEPSQCDPDSSSIRVSDRSAHAWCEVYIEGCGWYPVEFTPGYTNDNPNLTESEKPTEKKAAVTDSESKDESSESASSSSSSKSPETSKSETKSESSKSDTNSESSNSAENTTASDGTTNSADSEAAVGIVDGSGDDSGGGAATHSAKLKINKTTAVYTILSVLFILIAIAATVIRRKKRLGILDKSVNSPNSSESVIACYSHFLEALALVGISCSENETDTQSAKKISQKLSDFDISLVSPFLSLCETAVIAHMGNGKITEEDAQSAREIMQTACNSVYEHLSIFKRQYAKWVSNIF